MRITTLPDAGDPEDRRNHTFHPLREQTTCGEGDVLEFALVPPAAPQAVFDIASRVEVVPAPRAAARREARSAASSR